MPHCSSRCAVVVSLLSDSVAWRGRPEFLAASRPFTNTSQPGRPRSRRRGAPSSGGNADRAGHEAGLMTMSQVITTRSTTIRAHSPRPAAELAGRLALVACRGGSLGTDRGPALKDRADEEGDGEERERKPDPGLAEVPGVAVEDEPDAEAEHGDHRRCEHERADHTQAADETGDRVGLTPAKHLGRKRAEGDEAAEPDHRG